MAASWLDVARTVAVMLLCSALVGAITAQLFFPRTIRESARSVQAGVISRTEAFAEYGVRVKAAAEVSSVVLQFVLVLILSVQYLSGDVASILPVLRPATLLATGVTCTSIWALARDCVAFYSNRSGAFAVMRGRPTDRRFLWSLLLTERLPRHFVLLVLLWVGALLSGLHLLGLIWLIPLLTVLVFLVHDAFAMQEVRWWYPSTPIEQTAWADLEPRIRAWAAYAGVRIGSIEVLDTNQFGASLAGEAGWGLPTVYFSENVLGGADWRQQDALTAIVLGLVRYRAGVRLLKSLYALGEGIALAALFVGMAVAESNDLSSFLLFALTAVVTSIFVSRHILWRLFAGYKTAHYASLQERFAAGLTGDPLAMIVALHTLYELAFVPLPLHSDRLKLLNQLRGQPGHWAPWADLPVPSAIPFTIDGQTLTAPLESAPPPPPVPTAPYPERGPVLLGILASKL